jgi:hypothetical protein
MPEPERRKALVEVAELAEDYLLTRASAVISPRVDEAALKARADELLAAGPRPLAEVAADLFAMLREGIVRTDSPRYFGTSAPSTTARALASGWPKPCSGRARGSWPGSWTGTAAGYRATRRPPSISRPGRAAAICTSTAFTSALDDGY